jgi:thiol-disulfide isomerase/thioredoxin
MSPCAPHCALILARVTALLCLVTVAAPSCKQNSDKNPDQPAEVKKDAGTAPPPADGGNGNGNGNGNGEQAGQWYRVWVDGGPEVGKAPFFLRLPPRPGRGTALMANGNHRIEAEARWYGPEVSVNQELLRTRLFLRQDAEGKLNGHLMSRSPVVEGTMSIPLQAEPVPEPDDTRLFPDAASCGAGAASEGAAGDPDRPSGKEPATAPEDKDDKKHDKESDKAGDELWGKWLVSFENEGEAELVLEQARPGVITASFTFGDGTVSVLHGNMFGSRICLSGFDGVNTFLAVLDREPGGTLRGRWFAGVALQMMRSRLTAEKREQVEVLSNSIRFKPNRTKVSLFELGLPQYRGKPVIVEFGASWCPPCLDSAPVLRELYERHHGQGLEIVTLLFEMLDDEDALRQNARLFVEQHEIPWQVIPVRGDLKPYWDIVPHDPDAAEVNLPVTIFVNADGTIRDAHTGFPAPGSGKSYQDMVERYQRVAAELLAK